MNPRAVQIAAYGVATLAQSLSGFIVVPVLLRVGGTGVFAQWALLEPFLIYGVMITLLGANFGLLKLIGLDHLTQTQAVRHIRRPVLAQTLVALVLAMAGGWIAYHDVGLAAAMGVFVAIEAFFNLYQVAARASSNAFAYAGSVVVKFSIIIAGLLLALWSGQQSLPLAWLVGLYAGGSALGVGTAMLLSRGAAAKTETPADVSYAAVIRYGLPMTAAAVLAGVVGMADRYIINQHLTLSDVAAYVALAKLINVINMAAAPLNLWFPSARFRHVNDVDGGARFFSTLLVVVIAGITTIAGTIFYLIPVVFPYFAPGLAWSPATSAFLLAAVSLAVVTNITNIGLLSEGKTHFVPLILFIVAIAQGMLLLSLVPRWGAAGAGLATMLAQALNLALIITASQKAHRIRWRILPAIAIAVPFSAAIAVSMISTPIAIIRPAIFLITFLVALLALVPWLKRELSA